MKETKMCNIATVNWLMKAVGANLPLKKLIKFRPNDMLCCTDELANEFQRKYDIFSDSFTKKVSVDQLKSILNAVDEKVNEHCTHYAYEFFCQFSPFLILSKDLDNVSRSDMHQLEVELAGDSVKPVNVFRLATALFDKASAKCAKRMELAEQLFVMRGGKVKTDMGTLSHIFVDSNGFDVDRFVMEYSTSRDAIKNIRVVSFEWVIQCFHSGKKCSVKSFQLTV